MSKTLVLAVALVTIIAGGLLKYAGSKSPAMTPIATTASAQETTAAPATTAPETTVSSQASKVPDMILGKTDAPVTVVEYASFTCPHCANFHATVWDQFKKNYIDTGKVKFVYREVYFDKFGLWGAMVARCGGPEKYFGIADMLYDGQRDWLASGEPTGISDALRKIGLKAGLAADAVNACLDDKDMAQAMITNYQTNATADKVEGTPTFIINGESHGGEMSYEEFAALVDAKLPK